MTEADRIVDRAVTHTSAQWPDANNVMLCCNCESLYRSGHHCIFCGSENVLNLANIINRVN